MEPLILVIPIVLSLLNCCMTCVHVNRSNRRMNNIESVVQTLHFKEYPPSYQYPVAPPAPRPSAPPASAPPETYVPYTQAAPPPVYNYY
jgi:hypothetical protein